MVSICTNDYFDCVGISTRFSVPSAGYDCSHTVRQQSSESDGDNALPVWIHDHVMATAILHDGD